MLGASSTSVGAAFALLLILAVAVFLWALPIWVARQIGKPKHRTAWWAFWLGWFGVLIVYLLPPREIREWDAANVRWKT